MLPWPQLASHYSLNSPDAHLDWCISLPGPPSPRPALPTLTSPALSSSPASPLSPPTLISPPPPLHSRPIAHYPTPLRPYAVPSPRPSCLSPRPCPHLAPSAAWHPQAGRLSTRMRANWHTTASHVRFPSVFNVQLSSPRFHPQTSFLSLDLALPLHDAGAPLIRRRKPFGVISLSANH